MASVGWHQWDGISVGSVRPHGEAASGARGSSRRTSRPAGRHENSGGRVHVRLTATSQQVTQVRTWPQGEPEKPSVPWRLRHSSPGHWQKWQKSGKTRYRWFEDILSELDLLSVPKQERDVNVAGRDCGLLKSTWNVYRKHRLLGYKASPHKRLNRQNTAYYPLRLEADS